MTSSDHQGNDALQQEVAALTTALHGIDLRLKATLSKDEVQIRLARAKAEVGRRRRLAFLSIVTLMVTALQAADEHTERCRVGAVKAGVLRPLDKSTQFMCDFTNPTHTHVFGPAAHYPSIANVLGVTFYTVIFLAMFLWVAYMNKRSYERAELGLDPDIRQKRKAGERPD